MFPQAQRSQLLVVEAGDELVVYDQARHRAHRLNATAAMVWRHCNGETSVADLARLLEKEFGLSGDEDLIWLALNRLKTAHLLHGPLDRRATDSVSRRRVVRKLALTTTLTFLLPVVTSLIAPTPLMSQSLCCNCW